MALLWILPLFPAEPKLGPVYYNVTHFVPPAFPLLLLRAGDRARPSAAASRRAGACGARRSRRAPCSSPCSSRCSGRSRSFLQSPWARNWFFGTHYFGYYEHPSWLDRQYRFWPAGTPLHFWTVMALAVVVAVVTSALGLRVGDWMRRLKR